MNWRALNGRLCGILIDFSLEEGLVLFLKKRIEIEETRSEVEIADIAEIGNYLAIYLEDGSGGSKSAYTVLLGRLKDLYWKSEEAIEEEYGFRFKFWRKGIKSESTSVIASTGFGDTMPIDLSGNPCAIGKIKFLGVPKKIPRTWMKVFEASEENVGDVLKVGGESTGLRVRISPERWISVDFQERHLTDNVLIVGSYEDFLSMAIKQMLKFSNLPKIVLTQRAEAEFSDFDRTSIRDFQRLVSNGFGFEYRSDEQILNAATSLNPPQVRLLSNLLVQVREEKKETSKLETLKKIVDKNTETNNDRYSEDLERIIDFLETRDRNLRDLIIDNKITIVDVLDEGESRQIAFSRFLDAVQEEIDNRRRKKASLLEFLLFIENIEDYAPSSSQKGMNSSKSISKVTFRKFMSHPDTEKIGLIMSTRFPSMIDPSIFYLCPNRLFGEVFERRELMKIKDVFGIEEIEIKKLRFNPRREDEMRILLNLPSRFSADVVDGILMKERWYYEKKS
jgi:hypothetical protein